MSTTVPQGAAGMYGWAKSVIDAVGQRQGSPEGYHYAHLLAGLIPQAKVKIYPDSAHGFLFQHAAEFAADVEAFLCD